MENSSVMEQGKTKTFRFNNGKGFKFTWGNITAIITFAILVGGFLIDRGAKQEQFKNHEKSMTEMRARLKVVEEWQKDKLALDGVQNTKLEELARRITVLEK